jgi:hypothetical protein
MNLHKRLAALFVILALVGCAQVAPGRGQAPYSHDDEERMDRPP